MNRNILITSAGRRVSLTRIFRQELRKKFPEAKIIAVDCHPELSAACKIADVSAQVPAAGQQEYIGALLELCIKHSVGMLIPTIDIELQILAQNKHAFSKVGTECMLSDSDFIMICRNKRSVLKFFSERNIQVPVEYHKSNLMYPVIAKPIAGSASINVYLAYRREQLPESVFEGDEYIFLQYADARYFTEFTADMYYDKQHVLQCVVPRQRIEVRNGEVSKATTRKNTLINLLADKLHVIEGVQGVINAQVFYNSATGELIASEINPRFGGGYPLSYAAGANFPAMLIDEYYLHRKPTYFDGWKENITMLRYDAEIIVDNEHGTFR
jgi:carbamoyl-phosphate synthase large subunit